MVEVRLDAMLREFGAPARTDVPAESVKAVLEGLERQYPRLKHRIRDETGTVRRYVRIFVNGEAIPEPAGLDVPLRAEDRVEILHSIQGG